LRGDTEIEEEEEVKEAIFFSLTNNLWMLLQGTSSGRRRVEEGK